MKSVIFYVVGIIYTTLCYFGGKKVAEEYPNDKDTNTIFQITCGIVGVVLGATMKKILNRN